MYEYEIKVTGSQNFLEEDLYNLNNENVIDGILCIRTHEGESVILKSDLKIKIVKAQNVVKYNSAK